MGEKKFPVILPPGLINALRGARHVAVLTGAGISAESGLPTFRDATSKGLWSRYSPANMATAEGFKRDPRYVWQWYAWRRDLAVQAEPNAGHLALAEVEQHVPTFTLITQNVDSLHQRAGSQNVTELHGNIARTKCFDENIVVEQWEETDELPPRCPRCGGMLRPDVVWFGEALPEAAFHKAVEASANCDVFFSIGTSGMVEPAASLIKVAQHFGATVAVLNLEVTPLDTPKMYHLQGRAGEVLPALVTATWGEG